MNKTTTSKHVPHDAQIEPAPTRARERRQRVQSAETGMTVLKGLARLGGRASLTALAAHVGESPAKVHRYLASLMEAELVVQDAGSQHYHLGPEALLIGLAAMHQNDPIRMAEPALVRLCEQLDVTCFVAVMGNKGPTIVRIEEPGLPVTVNVRAGSVLSLVWSATGRVFWDGWTTCACAASPKRNLPRPRPNCAPSSARPIRSAACAATCVPRIAPPCATPISRASAPWPRRCWTTPATCAAC